MPLTSGEQVLGPRAHAAVLPARTARAGRGRDKEGMGGRARGRVQNEEEYEPDERFGTRRHPRRSATTQS
ncbi:hypothetical protein [Streptomyces tsukubensis]|uniref:Uncharacterized protein n=1 Tax=Streptomyces tsukubensis TaxID=83656 RepID=A0A1V3ZYK4_9ACTN|nr:hypothetical protein [Streptomyces tsukubensis]OON71503.1 hypothetical protein B1H18_33625 [Streptomyces tsukubensis]QFR96915.1 hypothetical protein GBW32_32565 [Streptomyces tsukubensis]